MRFLVAVLLVVSSSFFVLPVSAQQTDKPETAGLSSQRLRRIHAMLQNHVERHDIAGAVALVARRGQLVYLDAVGLSELATSKPMTTNVIFRITSMTKPITATALMTLYEEGRFLLSDPVSKFLPEFKTMRVLAPANNAVTTTGPLPTVPAQREITILDLLTHRAGLPSFNPSPTSALYDELSSRSKTTKDLALGLAQIPLNFQPGTAYEYGVAYDVLGYLIEVISGKPLDVFFQERIFRPLGMKDTYFYLPPAKRARLAATYAPDSNANLRVRNAQGEELRQTPKLFSGGGGLKTTVRDYFRFAQMLLNGGELDGTRLLSRKTIELMLTDQVGSLYPSAESGSGWGFGGEVRTSLKGGEAGSVGRYGWEGMFGNAFWIDPKEKMIGILMLHLFPNGHLNIQSHYEVLATQAIVD